MKLYRCQYCSNKRNAHSDDEVRVAGWRIWSGTTVAGKTTSVLICPACSGATDQEAETGDPVGYDAVCDTCMESASEEWGEWGEECGPLTETEAEQWADQHRCEPHVRTIGPARATTGAAT